MFYGRSFQTITLMSFATKYFKPDDTNAVFKPRIYVYNGYDEMITFLIQALRENNLYI